MGHVGHIGEAELPPGFSQETAEILQREKNFLNPVKGPKVVKTLPSHFFFLLNFYRSSDILQSSKQAFDLTSI